MIIVHTSPKTRTVRLVIPFSLRAYESDLAHQDSRSYDSFLLSPSSFASLSSALTWELTMSAKFEKMLGIYDSDVISNPSLKACNN